MKFKKGQLPWNKRLKTPQDVREKQSKSAIKRFENPLERQKMSERRKGYKMSEGAKKKQGLRMMGNQYRIGKKDTEEARRLKSEARKKEWAEGRRRGIKQSKEIIEKRVKRGKEHYNWQGGITNKYRSIRRQKAYQEWRMAVWKRDNFKCQMPFCEKKSKILNAHHIIPLRERENLKYDVDNGITLCKICHEKTKWKEKEYEFADLRRRLEKRLKV